MIVSIDKGRISDKIQGSFMTKSLGGPGIGRNFHEEQLQIPRANIRLLCALLEPPSPFAVCSSCGRCSHCTTSIVTAGRGGHNDITFAYR